MWISICASSVPQWAWSRAAVSGLVKVPASSPFAVRPAIASIFVCFSFSAFLPFAAALRRSLNAKRTVRIAMGTVNVSSSSHVSTNTRLSKHKLFMTLPKKKKRQLISSSGSTMEDPVRDSSAICVIFREDRSLLLNFNGRSSRSIVHCYRQLTNRKLRNIYRRAQRLINEAPEKRKQSKFFVP